MLWGNGCLKEAAGSHSVISEVQPSALSPEGMPLLPNNQALVSGHLHLARMSPWGVF